MKEQLDSEKSSRLTILTDYNKISAFNDSLKSLDQDRQLRTEKLGKESSEMKEEIEKLKRCYYECIILYNGLLTWNSINSETTLVNREIR